MAKIDDYVNISNLGIERVVYVGEELTPTIDSLIHWEEILENFVESECNLSGQIAVEDENDGVFNLMSMAETFRTLADDLEEKVRSRKVLVTSPDEKLELSYQQFVRGFYPRSES